MRSFDNYDVKDLRFLKMAREPLYKLNANSALVFEIEKELTLVEKIKIIDALHDGIATYMLELIAQWEEDVDSLPKQRGHRVKTVSFQAWIRRNDDRKKISESTLGSSLGTYRMFGERYNIQWGTTIPDYEFSINPQSLAYSSRHVVHQWFHDLCDELYRHEASYHKNHDPVNIKIKTLIGYKEKFGTPFNEKKLNMIVWNHRIVEGYEVASEDLDRYIAAYKRIEDLANEINAEWGVTEDDNE